MCVAIAANKEFPTAEVLNRCELANPHGGGIAWIEDGMVRWVKGLTATQIIKAIDEKKVSVPALIHFRIATSGGIRNELCHPFPISANASTDLTGRAKAVLIHNGHWSGWGSKVLNKMTQESKGSRGFWSDSRALAWLGARYGDAVYEMSEQKIGILDASKGLTIWGKGWEKEGEIYYSNKVWKWRQYGSSWKNRSDEEWEAWASDWTEREVGKRDGAYNNCYLRWERTVDDDSEVVDDLSEQYGA